MSKNPKTRPPLLEWVASATGLLLALAMLGVIGWEAFHGTSSAPSIVVQAEEVIETEDGFTVRIRVINRGEGTASDVVVEGELKRGDETVETSETTFAFVPGSSERGGGLFFSENPRVLALRLRAHGYTDP